MAWNSVQQASIIISLLVKGHKRLEVNKTLWVWYRSEGQRSFQCPEQLGGRTFHGWHSVCDCSARPSPPCLLDRWADLLIRLIPGGPGWSPAGTNKGLLALVSVGHLQCFASPFDSEPFNFSHQLNTDTVTHTHDQTQNAVYHLPEVEEMYSPTFKNVYKICKPETKLHRKDEGHTVKALPTRWIIAKKRMEVVKNVMLHLNK